MTPYKFKRHFALAQLKERCNKKNHSFAQSNPPVLALTPEDHRVQARAELSHPHSTSFTAPEGFWWLVRGANS